MFARVADVQNLAGWERLGDKDAHFELEVEGLRRGVGWRCGWGGLNYAAGAVDRSVCDFETGGTAIVDWGDEEEAGGYGGVHYFCALWVVWLGGAFGGLWMGRGVRS